jgi:cation-transporting P-type ATPase 13A2
MLYPKPIGFKFYRDSIRFITVLAGVAVLAFCASVVQFVRLGVRLFSSACFTLNLGLY